MSNQTYESKYLKYKIKYENLKKVIGGVLFPQLPIDINNKIAREALKFSRPIDRHQFEIYTTYRDKYVNFVQYFNEYIALPGDSIFNPAKLQRINECVQNIIDVAKLREYTDEIWYIIQMIKQLHDAHEKTLFPPHGSIFGCLYAINNIIIIDTISPPNRYKFNINNGAIDLIKTMIFDFILNILLTRDETKIYKVLELSLHDNYHHIAGPGTHITDIESILCYYYDIIDDNLFKIIQTYCDIYYVPTYVKNINYHPILHNLIARTLFMLLIFNIVKNRVNILKSVSSYKKIMAIHPHILSDDFYSDLVDRRFGISFTYMKKIVDDIINIYDNPAINNVEKEHQFNDYIHINIDPLIT